MNNYHFVIVYDEPDSRLVRCSLTEAADVPHAIAEFEKIYKGYRILAVQMVHRDICKSENWQKRIDAEWAARQQVVDAMED